MTLQKPPAGTQFRASEAGAAGLSGRSRPGVWFRPRRQPGRVGVLSLVRLLVSEVILVALLFVVLQQLWVLIAGGVLGVLLVVGVFGRSGGQWWTENLVLRLRYRLRDGAAGERRDDPRLAALCELAPDLVVENIEGHGDIRLGMGSDGAGWFTVLEVVTAGMNGLLPPVPLAALARISADAEQTGVVIQVVSHSTPVAGAEIRDHVTWVAIRLDAQAVAESVIDDPDGQVDVPGVLAEITRRVDRVLRRRGLNTRLLGADEVVDALARSCDLSSAGGPAQVREGWDAWHSARLSHGCFWLRSWPDPERGTRMLAALAGLRGALVSIAFLLEPTYDGTSMTCLVRVATPPDRYRQTCDTVVRLAEQAGGRLSRLDGQHAPAVYASTPSGGGAR
jgi:type VII secretion protein EccE